MKTKPRISALFLLFCIACTSLFMMAQAEQKVVRVGCIDIENFIEIDENGNASGYCEEYLQRLSLYTGWEYEYVQGTRDERQKWLQDGKIDLLMPVEHSDERTQQYLFSDVECCLDYAALFVTMDDEFYYEDFAAFDGMKVGMIKGNFLNDLFAEYAATNGFSYTPEYYSKGSELGSALDLGEIDTVVSGNMAHKANQKLLAKIDYMPAYFVTSINNPELMKELNSAQHKIFLNNPYYTADLQDKYYDSRGRQFASFTKQEYEYIQKKGEITIALNDSNNPMEWVNVKSGEVQGVYDDMPKLIESKSGLRFRFVTDEENQAWDMAKRGDADAWGSAFGYRANSGDNSFSYTNSYYDSNYSLVGIKSRNLNLSEHLTTSVLKNEIGLRNLVEKRHDNWKIVTYDTEKECFADIKNSKVDFAAVSAWRLSTNPRLLDKGILKVARTDLRESALNSVLAAQGEASLLKRLMKSPLSSSIAVALLTVFVLMWVFIFYRAKVQKQKNYILEAKNRELKAAVEEQERLRKLAETDSLTGLRNKRQMEEACQNYMDAHPDQKHAVAVIDIDCFKQINDSYGHLHGDEILKQFAQKLFDSCDPEDVVARIGGDEFMAFAPNIDEGSTIEERAARLHASLAECMDEKANRPITCSVGVSIISHRKGDFKRMFSLADEALYKVKEKGRNGYAIIEDTGEPTMYCEG